MLAEPVLTNQHSFDAASLAILEKLGTIEQLIRSGDSTHQRILSTVVDDVVEDTSPQSHVKSLNSPSLERTRDTVRCHMNIENVLSWSVFEDQYPNLDLKSLLLDDSSPFGQIKSVSDYEHASEEALLQRFMDHIFIFNPILEEAKLQTYVRDARYNGMGWDAQSCLLVKLSSWLRL